MVAVPPRPRREVEAGGAGEVVLEVEEAVRVRLGECRRWRRERRGKGGALDRSPRFAGEEEIVL